MVATRTDDAVLDRSVNRRSRKRRHDLVVTQLAFPSYRQEFVRALEKSGEDILLLVGDRQFGEGVVTDVSSSQVRRTGRNVYLLGKRAVWQRGCLVAGFLAKNLVIEINPRNLTSWLLLISRILTGRGVVAWGHAHSRRGPNPEYNRIRRVMESMCAELITYTETEARELAEIFGRKKIVPARNSLYTIAQMSQFELTDLADRPDLVLIGRLVPEKKALLGLAAFERARASIPPGVVLHIVGSGIQEQEIRDYAAKSGLSDQIRLYGWVSDLDQLAPIFERCRGLVAPGYIGLNATQALGFGLAVVYPRDDPHAPEIEALDATNSIVFETDDAEGCSKAIVELYQNPSRFDSRRIAEAARRKYSTDRMIEPFVGLARNG